MDIKRILAPTDFSDYARPALDYALFMARRLGARVDVLNVWELPIDIRPDWIVQMPGEPPQAASDLVRKSAARQLELLVAELAKEHEQVHGRLEMGNPAETIVRIAERDRYDLIVMGTHGRSGLSRAWSGSVAEKVVRRSPCPVLSIRTPEKKPA